MKYLSKISWLLLLFFVLLVFKVWFSLSFVDGGDFPFFGYSTIPLLPYAWGNLLTGGLGESSSSLLWAIMQFTIPLVIFGKILHLPWVLIERFAYLYPFLILSIFSSYFLARKILNRGFILAPLIFLANTYMLLVLGGGQLTIMLAISVSPIVLAVFISLIDQPKIKNALIAGLLLSLSLTLDPRITYVTLVMIAIYTAHNVKTIFKNWIQFLKLFSMVSVITVLLNSFWLLPTLLSHQNPVAQLGAAYTSVGAVQYFSFAKFENAITLLHPNWPENIFGKVYFMRPEFLILPILAFMSLFFIKRKEVSREKTFILFFALLGLIGAFLAKGSNDPFGGIYLWMFNHVPGFVMFRDSTKFYLLIAISYSILIPFSVSKIYELIKRKTENLKPKILGNLLPKLFIVLVVGYLLFLIRPALLGQLGGTFKTTTIPAEYTKLEQFLSSQENFSRTLWMPTNQRFGFYSNNHPAISAQDLFSIYDNKKLIQKLNSSEKLLQESSVRYVVIPYDSQGEIFLSDRKYDDKGYLQTIDQVKKIPWLMPVSGFGKIAVFAVPNAKDHFYITDQKSELAYEYISPVEYSLNVQNAKKGGRVVFAESYDAKWTATNSEFKIQSSEFNGRFNSFVLPKDGNYNLKIYYTPQDYVNLGVVISLISLVGSLGALIVLKIKKQ